MFNSISWQEFFHAITLLIGGYYVIATLLLYGSELTNLFNQKNRNFTKSDAQEVQTASNSPDNLMGAVRYENPRELNVPREEQVSSEDIVATPSEEPEEPIQVAQDSSPEEILALAIEEVKAGIRAIVTSDPVCGKADFITLLRALLSHYPQLGESIHRVEIHGYVIKSCYEHFEFELQPNEILSLWSPEEERQS